MAPEGTDASHALLLGKVVQRLDDALEVQDAHGKLLNHIVAKIDDREEICAKRHEAHLKARVGPVIAGATSPSQVARQWGADPLVWAVVALVLLIAGAFEEWLRYTWNTTNDVRTKVTVNERIIQQIPAQMAKQDQKIDKILTTIKGNNGHNNP